MERLQKYISNAGITSRRKAENLIVEGKVKVNDQVVTTLGFLVGKNDIVKVNDIEITKVQEKIYLALNKPRSYLSTTSDDLNRKTVIDLIPNNLSKYRLYPVGRLDYDTSGIILLTNDGEFMNMMVGPKSGVTKTYQARINGIMTKEEVELITKGLKTKDVTYLPSNLEIISVDRKNNSSLVKLTITEGMNHQVKKMFDYLNHKVKKLTRIAFGNITIEGLPLGAVRYLTIHEVKTLVGLSKQNKNLRERK